MVAQRLAPVAGWLGFGLLLAGIAWMLLAACELGLRPLFGLRYCPAPPRAAAPLEGERERSGTLRARIHAQQLRLAQMPACVDTPPRRAEAPARAPAQTDVPPHPPLRMPTRLGDLRGCWQSVRGDIEVKTDDAAARLVGRARICYCFAGEGRGTVTWRFSGGGQCDTPATATLDDGVLRIGHRGATCPGGQHVPEDITCRKGQDGVAACDVQSLGETRRRREGERFAEVSAEECERGPP